MKLTFTNTLSFKTLILFIALTCFWGCKKHDPKPGRPTSIPVTITSLSVSSGPYNTTVVISGTGFDNTPSNDKVYFNNTVATVSAATSTQLTVTVPLKAGTGNVSVSVNNATKVTGPVFIYQYTGIVTTFAGSGASGKADGPASQATFNTPFGIAADAAGNIYVADLWNNLIRKVSPSGDVTTLAGSGTYGFANGNGTSASFAAPTGVAVDASGNVYVADSDNNRIRKISPTGVVTTFAGSGSEGRADGPGTAASFYFPRGVAVDAAGNVYVADFNNYVIRKISPTGDVSTLAGSGAYGFTNGQGLSASFQQPTGVCVDLKGNVYVADWGNSVIRKIDTKAVVTTLAGIGGRGADDGPGTLASFNYPTNVVTDTAGNVYVADQFNNLIRMITPDGVVSTIAGSGSPGSANGVGTASSFKNPYGITIDTEGNLYVGDTGNGLIRKITLQ